MTDRRQSRTKPSPPPRKPRHRASWAGYETSKSPLAAAGLTPSNYARAVRRLARKLGV